MYIEREKLYHNLIENVQKMKHKVMINGIGRCDEIEKALNLVETMFCNAYWSEKCLDDCETPMDEV